MTREALERSISAWEQRLTVPETHLLELGEDDCPLCELFNNEDTGGCEGCPVQAKTGKHHCRGTPYMDVFYAYRARKPIETVRPLIQQEIDFLRSLRT